MIENIDFSSYSWKELVDSQLGIDYSSYRGWVYVSVKHFREPDVLDLRGGESDAFDPFSRHFIARDQRDGKIVGCTRVIRGGVGVHLPATHHFPGCLDDHDLDIAAVGEVSRFISTAGGQRIRRDVALLLIRELATYSLERSRNHVVFVIERPLGRWLQSLGVPLEALDDERWIDEENGCLTPFLVDLKECDRSLAEAHSVYALSPEQGLFAKEHYRHP
jgi:N-acyl-L-homoserine lactone synthetase